MTIEEARNLMHDWISNPALRVHMECVAACMGELGVDETQHIQTCIDAIRGERERLGV